MWSWYWSKELSWVKPTVINFQAWSCHIAIPFIRQWVLVNINLIWPVQRPSHLDSIINMLFTLFTDQDTVLIEELEIIGESGFELTLFFVKHIATETNVTWTSKRSRTRHWHLKRNIWDKVRRHYLKTINCKKCDCEFMLLKLCTVYM